jgi:hypothetical protein
MFRRNMSSSSVSKSKPIKKPARTRQQEELHKLAACFVMVSFLAHFSALNIEATCSFETWLDFQQTTLSYIPEDRTLYVALPFLRNWIRLAFYGTQEVIFITSGSTIPHFPQLLLYWIRTCCQLGTDCINICRCLYQVPTGRQKSKVVWIPFWSTVSFHFI